MLEWSPTFAMLINTKTGLLLVIHHFLASCNKSFLVSFRSSSDMKKAVDRMDGYEIHGRRITVKVKKFY